MSDVARGARQEFWRPPVGQAGTTTQGMVEVCEVCEVCDGCAAEFMAGSMFCHSCGASRSTRAVAATHWTIYLEFHNLKSSLGLSTASLIAFFAGILCLVMAGVAVGMIYSVQTFNDFHAVQLYRMQWLLAAIAAFVAGCLLKKMPGEKS